MNDPSLLNSSWPPGAVRISWTPSSALVPRASTQSHNDICAINTLVMQPCFPETHTCGTYTPGTYTSGTYTPGTYTPETFTAGTYTPDTYTSATYTPETFTAGTYTSGTYIPGTYTAGTYRETQLPLLLQYYWRECVCVVNRMWFIVGATSLFIFRILTKT